MQILIDGRLLSKSHTGISRYTEYIIKGALNTWGKENVKVIVNPGIVENTDFDTIITSYKPFNLLHFFKFHKFLKSQQFDLLFTPFYANSFFKVRGVKYVSVVHDLMYSLVPNFFSTNTIVNKLGKLYYDIIVGRSLRNSDEIISVSQTTSNDVLAKFNRNSVVYKEGINKISLNEENDTDILAKYGLAKNQYFLYVGIDRPHKNLDFLCRSFNRAKTDRKLVLCGRHAKKYQGKNILQLGYVADNGLNNLYSNSAAFVYPSKYEGFGLPVLEALSLGTKVISSNLGSLKEFSDEFVSFFDPQDEESLIRAFESIDNLKIDRNRLQNYLASFNWDVIASEIMKYCNTKFLR